MLPRTTFSAGFVFDHIEVTLIVSFWSSISFVDIIFSYWPDIVISTEMGNCIHDNDDIGILTFWTLAAKESQFVIPHACDKAFLRNK